MAEHPKRPDSDCAFFGPHSPPPAKSSSEVQTHRQISVQVSPSLKPIKKFTVPSPQLPPKARRTYSPRDFQQNNELRKQEAGGIKGLHNKYTTTASAVLSPNNFDLRSNKGRKDDGSESFPLGLYKVKQQDFSEFGGPMKSFSINTRSAIANVKLQQSLTHRQPRSKYAISLGSPSGATDLLKLFGSERSSFSVSLSPGPHSVDSRQNTAKNEEIRKLGHPSKRKDIEAIAEWFVKELSYLEKAGKSEDENFEDAHKVYTKVINVLSEEITKSCSEAGTLLRRLWNEYHEMVKGKIAFAFSFARARDQQVNQIASNILTKYEAKVKENEQKFREMREQIGEYERTLGENKKRLLSLRGENEGLRKKQHAMMEESRKISQENSELKEINKVMRSYFCAHKAGESSEAEEEAVKKMRDQIIHIKLKAKKIMKELKDASPKHVAELNDPEEDKDMEEESPAKVPQRKVSKMGTLTQGESVLKSSVKRISLRSPSELSPTCVESIDNNK